MVDKELSSGLCRQYDFDSQWYQKWSNRICEAHDRWRAIRQQVVRHRKLWEWCAVAQAFEERGLLGTGRTGIGFAVGKGPLPSLLASAGTRLLISDFVSGRYITPWDGDSERADSIDSAAWPGLVDLAVFRKRVAYLNVDIRDLRYLPSCFYDFSWSTCAIDHLGDIRLGLKFLLETMRCVKIGGVAAHTVNFVISTSNGAATLGSGPLCSRQDIETLDRLFRRAGCVIEDISFESGMQRHDVAYDTPPYYNSGRQHIKLQMGDAIVTSMLLIVRKWDEHFLTINVG